MLLYCLEKQYYNKQQQLMFGQIFSNIFVKRKNMWRDWMRFFWSVFLIFFQGGMRLILFPVFEVTCHNIWGSDYEELEEQLNLSVIVVETVLTWWTFLFFFGCMINLFCLYNPWLQIHCWTCTKVWKKKLEVATQILWGCFVVVVAVIVVAVVFVPVHIGFSCGQ